MEKMLAAILLRRCHITITLGMHSTVVLDTDIKCVDKVYERSD